MAPVPKTASTTKGKTWVYLCATCGICHTPPTGAACPRRRTLAKKPSTTRPKVVPAKSQVSVRKPGRPRKYAVVSDSEDESLEDIFVPATTSQKRKRPDVRGPEETPVSKGRPTPAPRAFVAWPPSEVPIASSDHEAEGTHQLLQAMMSQLNTMNAAHEAERVRQDTQQRQEREAVQRSLAEISARVDAITAVSAGNNPPEGARDPQPPPARPSTSTAQPPFTRNLPVQDTALPTHRGPHTRENLFPHSQPLLTDVTPQQLQEAREPVRDLRKDTASANVAEQIIKVVDLLEEEGSEKKTKSGYNKKLLRKNLAKWPCDYIYRMHDEDPTYDSLTAPEFVSGFMSIIEEVLPFNTDNRLALKLIHYLRSLMEDSPSSGWDTVRTAHKQVLNTIEYKRLVWEDTEAVYKMKTDALLHIK